MKDRKTMKILYILIGLLTFSIALCNAYMTDAELTQKSSPILSQSTQVSTTLHNTSTTNENYITKNYLNEEKLKNLVLYLDQYRSSNTLAELEDKHSMNDDSVILNIIQHYAKSSSLLECLHNCPNLINKDATDLLEAYITEIRYLHQEQFSSELSDILYVISRYRGK